MYIPGVNQIAGKKRERREDEKRTTNENVRGMPDASGVVTVDSEHVEQTMMGLQLLNARALNRCIF